MRNLLQSIIFLFCINIFSQTNNFNDCVGAIPICGDEPISYDPKGSGLNDFSSPNNFPPSCQFTESASLWLKIKVATKGTLSFTIAPNNNIDDYDFAIYKPESSCNDLGRSIRCSSTNPQAAGVSALTGLRDSENDTSEGPGTLGNGFVKSLSVETGEIYYIFINNYSQRNGFQLSWGGTASLDCNITCDLGIDVEKDACNTNTFDLNELETEVKNGDDQLDIIFYKTLRDAQNNITRNQITGTTYTTQNESETIYAKITNEENCVDYKTVKLNSVNFQVNNETFYFCEDDSSPSIMLENNYSNAQLNWYDSESSNTPIYTGTTFNPPLVTHDYFIQFTHNKISCTSSKAKISVIVEPKPTLSINTLYTNWFYNQTVNLQAIGNGLTYQWSGPNTTSTDPEIKFIASSDQKGTYTVTSKQNSACETSTSIDLNIYQDVESYLGEDVILCNDSQFKLSYPSIDGFQYKWSTGESTNEISITKEGTYQLTVTTPDGNQSTGEINITFLPNIELSITTPYNHYFYGDEMNLSVNTNVKDLTNFSYEWTLPNSNTIMEGETILIPIESEEQTGVYTVTGTTSENCIAQNNLNITTYIDVETALGDDIYLCKDQIITLSYPIDGLTYQWNNGETTQSIEINEEGTYQLTVTTPDGNQSTGTISIIASNLQLNEVYTCFNQIIAQAKGGTAPYQYSLDGINYQDNPLFTNIQSSGNYQIHIKDANSCEVKTDYTFIQSFVLHQLFSPNGDHINDEWNLSALRGCNKIDVKIFDRYGRFIYRMNSNNLIWNGKVGNKVLPSNTYWYHIDFNDGITPSIKSHITIKRVKN